MARVSAHEGGQKQPSCEEMAKEAIKMRSIENVSGYIKKGVNKTKSYTNIILM